MQGITAPALCLKFLIPFVLHQNLNKPSFAYLHVWFWQHLQRPLLSACNTEEAELVLSNCVLTWEDKSRIFWYIVCLQLTYDKRLILVYQYPYHMWITETSLNVGWSTQTVVTARIEVALTTAFRVFHGPCLLFEQYFAISSPVTLLCSLRPYLPPTFQCCSGDDKMIRSKNGLGHLKQDFKCTSGIFTQK